MHHWLILASLALVSSGCVSKEKYAALRLDRDRLAEQLGNAQTDAAQARSAAEAYKSQLDMIAQGGTGKDAMIANLTTQNADLRAQLDELNRKYADALGRVGVGVALPQELSNELSAFAAAHPDLVDFDASRGIVKFKSDVTFARGSADLTPNAAEAIARFAQILNSPAAAGYELLVAGHTDSTPVVQPETKAKHPDNWYLSAHRAISVAQAMMSQQVNPQRLGAVGYADQRPIASNGSESGKSQNRRVEVLILPTTVRTGAASSASKAPAPAPQLNKDTAAGTSMNK
jgi:chemotaxis protein MotB